MTGLFRVVEEPPQIVSTILPDLEMLPEVHASKPSWLMRRSRTPSPVVKDIPKFQPPTREPYRPPNREPYRPSIRELYIESKSDKVLWHLFKNQYCINTIITLY